MLLFVEKHGKVFVDFWLADAYNNTCVRQSARIQKSVSESRKNLKKVLDKLKTI